MIRLTFLFLLLFFSSSLFAQKSSKASLFPAQFKKVLTACSSGFTGVKGGKIKEDGADVVFASTFTLEGTTENRVMEFSSGKSYMAKLGEGLNEKEARALVEEWKKKTLGIAGSQYEAMKDDLRSSEMNRIAYLLMGEQSSISIYAIQYAGETTYNAYLLVMKL